MIELGKRISFLRPRTRTVDEAEFYLMILFLIVSGVVFFIGVFVCIVGLKEIKQERKLIEETMCKSRHKKKKSLIIKRRSLADDTSRRNTLIVKIDSNDCSQICSESCSEGNNNVEIV